ncbi:hypothetical protein YB2330_000715 [Saitoella coloradoensis]
MAIFGSNKQNAVSAQPAASTSDLALNQHIDGIEKEEAVGRSSGRSWKKWLIVGVVALVVILAAVLIPVGLVVIRPHTSSSSSSSSSSSGSSSADTAATIASASSKVPSYAKGTYLDFATWTDAKDFNLTFTNATVGGLSVEGLNTTWDDSAQCNENVPALNEEFPYGEQPIRGVNIGGWLVLEPFIVPSLFENYSLSQGIVDEYTLSAHLGPEKSAEVLQEHYSTFVTEDTFKEIAAAGLDHVRIPYPYWALYTLSGDPYVPHIAWRYLLRGIEWARRYGLRVNLDFHAVPGSQNGWNHSGRQGTIGWLNTTNTNGTYYGDVTLEMHKQLATFFAQERYQNVVTLYGLVNEPNLMSLEPPVVINWTAKAYDVVRNASFKNYIVYGDGFLGLNNWQGRFLNSSYPKMILDAHNYVIFNTGQLQMTHSGKLGYACSSWSAMINSSMDTATGFGPTITGEWSLADTDCSEYLNNVNQGTRWEGTYATNGVNVTESCPTGVNCTCTPANADPSDYADIYSQFLSQFAQAQMIAFENGWGWFYWTWDTEKSTQWSYKKSLAAGIIPEYPYARNYNCSYVADFVSDGLSDLY